MSDLKLFDPKHIELAAAVLLPDDEDRDVTDVGPPSDFIIGRSRSSHGIHPGPTCSAESDLKMGKWTEGNEFANTVTDREVIDPTHCNGRHHSSGIYGIRRDGFNLIHNTAAGCL